MEKFLSKIASWAQMLFALYLVAFAAYNLLRVISLWHTPGIVAMFSVLLAACIALLVFSVIDYGKLLKDEER